ncbi:MAG: type II/IV secretion system protein [Gemmatimonadaceae bacterium]|nr:type II/IV secretion system protein [Gemmatimonadaceae bacterium]
MTSTRQGDDITLADGLSREFLLHHRCCPARRSADGAIVVAIAPGGAADALDDIALAYRCPVTPEQVAADEVDRLIERLVTRADRSIELERGADDFNGEYDALADIRSLASEAPVVRYVNLLVRDAFEAGASDIHLEATRTGISARFRLDGALAPALEPPAELHQAVVSRIKLLAELDISERRRPQDGRIRVRLDSRELDLRVSTVPTMFGESVVLRLLDRGGRPVSLDELGLDSRLREGFEHVAARPHGMMLVTGPTGSGKTTTLYACLARRDAEREKILTVEDPVEYQLAGIAQVPVHRQSGVTFAAALRSLLRQDPDVIMVGEMRDAETAEVAVQAAMTGHLVFSTLHTNDAVGAIARLLDLGVPDYLVAATVEGIAAQRLVRRICEACATSYAPSPELVAELSGKPTGRVRLRRGAGCAACRDTGFRGRIGLFELALMTEELKDAVTRRAPRSELRTLARQGGMTSLREDGWFKVQAGLTTVEEVLRVAP